MTFISARAISKSYHQKKVLHDLSFFVEKGQILALVGPNGAGKTTLLKAILGLTSYEGELDVLGCKPSEGRAQLMENICFVADVAVLPRWMKVSQALDFVEGVHPRFQRNIALRFLEKTSINLHQRVRELSKGMVTQLHLALVMAIDVRLLVLDEPTLGLDIIYRKQFFRALLDDYYNEDRTIIITTHQVEEVESILTDLFIINDGQLLLKCSMDDFASRFVQITVDQSDAQQVKETLSPISHQKQFGRHLFIIDREKTQASLESFGELLQPSISDVFVALVSGGNNE